jgi:hypothetical protein
MSLVHLIAFAVFGLAGCIAGGAAGNWVYRESARASERAAAAHI